MKDRNYLLEFEYALILLERVFCNNRIEKHKHKSINVNSLQNAIQSIDLFTYIVRNV